MLDLGWTELLVIGIVALIVVGPKDLPVMFRALGRFTGRMRGLARDFTRAMDEAADQSGARDIARDLRSMSNPRSAATKGFKKATGLDEFDDPLGEDADSPARKPAGTATGADTAAGGGERGPNTAALAEKRKAEAQARREEAVRRANERAASYRGFDGDRDGDGADDSAPAGENAPAGTPAPAPGEDAPATRAAQRPEPVGGPAAGAQPEDDPAAQPRQDKA